MLLIKMNHKNKDQVLQSAVDVLKNGGIIAYPTETFYGLGTRIDREDSLQRLYEIKQRAREKAMPLIIGNKGQLPSIAADISSSAIKLMERFWPGPLTMLFPAKKHLSEFITAGTNKVAVRIPGESFALHLAKCAGFPFTSTSANPSGMPPAQDAEAVIRYFGDKIELIIDCGPAPGGLPSTIVDVTTEDTKILREGAVKKELLTY
jgi:L-threonylcarbamoyladenylate synthase